jgi:16S rRNA G527 N7-methylase RsmG
MAMGVDSPDPRDRLGPDGERRLRAVLDLLASEPRSVTSIREPEKAWRTHALDSLSGLFFAELASAERIADVGAGSGFPGLAGARARPAGGVVIL